MEGFLLASIVNGESKPFVTPAFGRQANLRQVNLPSAGKHDKEAE